jgi:hypothetical protein
MTARKTEAQAHARQLRALGWPLRRIARELGVALSSVSVWVRDVSGPEIPRPADSPPATRTRVSDEDGFRRCASCERLLPLREFNRHPRGRQWRCRQCFREYFRTRGDAHREEVRARKARRRREAQDFVISHLLANPCVDCGEPDPVLLEFDHVGPKREHICILVAYGTTLDALRREIASCEVVCANCHRKRTAQRGGWRRASPDWRDLGSRLLPAEERNLALVYDALEQSGCVDCGERDLRTLDFDHVAAKRGSVPALARDGVSERLLLEEIARCRVRCANCHRRRTAADDGRYRTRSPITDPHL